MADRLSDNDAVSQNGSGNDDEEVSELVTNIDEFIQKLQSNKSKTTQCNETSREISTPDDIISLRTDDLEDETKKDSKVSGNYQNELQVSTQNSLDDDSRGKWRQEGRQTVQNVYNDLTIAGSIEKLLSSDEVDTLKKLERIKPNASNSIIHKSFANEHRQKIPFPQVLHGILETAKENGYDDIFSWQKHGRSFRVLDKKLFVTTIMARYFNQTQYTSFQRQLALYGFVRLTRKGSEDCGSYYHERFLRGYPHLACIIQRTPVKGTGNQKLSLTETEPDFQTMNPVGIDSSNLVDEHKIERSFVEIDCVHDRKLPGTIKSEIQPNLRQDSSNTINVEFKNDHQNVVDDSAYDSTTIDDDEEDIDYSN